MVPAELRQPLHARAATTSERQVEATLRPRRSMRLRQRPGRGAAAGSVRSSDAHTAPESGAVRCAVSRRFARVTPPSTALTTLLKQVGLTTADEELVPYPNPVHTCYPSLRRGK